LNTTTVWIPPKTDPGFAGAVWNSNGGTGAYTATGNTGARLKISSGGMVAI
jgi:hypothetical protein